MNTLIKKVNREDNFYKKQFTDKEIDFVLTQAINRVEENKLYGMEMRNTASLRRVLFFTHFFANRGNATKAAIAAGYSSRSAKQQGHRVLRWIQKEVKRQ